MPRLGHKVNEYFNWRNVIFREGRMYYLEKVGHKDDNKGETQDKGVFEEYDQVEKGNEDAWP